MANPKKFSETTFLPTVNSDLVEEKKMRGRKRKYEK